MVIFFLGLNDAFRRADSGTAWSISVSYALGAGVCVDLINIIASSNCVDRTFWFAGSAVGAFFSNVKCHSDFLA